MSKKIRLLLVDDEVRFLETLRQRLELRDFDVTAATNGMDALDAAGKGTFDLALLDLKMPGMDGEEVLAKLKERDPHIEVVILTGHGTIDSAVRTTKLGSHAYLQKPCTTEELLVVLKDAYRKRVQAKMNIEKAKMDELLRAGLGESPLAILRRLREIEAKEDSSDG